MKPEYAPKGLIGLLTPQGNTTVEPEFATLMPDGVAWLNARLISSEPTIRGRLIDYMRNLSQASQQFGSAPLDALGLACTGTGYFVGAAQEDTVLASVSQEIKVPVFSAGTAVVDALTLLGAKSIVLVSPYDGEVDQACDPYWQERGYRIVHKLNATGAGGFHPIYSLHSQDADKAIDALDTSGIDAIVILGTGMPTLASLVRLHDKLNVPVLSCMLCLGWRAACVVDESQFTPECLRRWANGTEWAGRLSRFA